MSMNAAKTEKKELKTFACWFSSRDTYLQPIIHAFKGLWKLLTSYGQIAEDVMVSEV